MKVKESLYIQLIIIYLITLSSFLNDDIAFRWNCKFFRDNDFLLMFLHRWHLRLGRKYGIVQRMQVLSLHISMCFQSLN